MAEYTIVVPGEVVPKQSMRVRAVPYYNDKTRKCDAFIQTYQKKEITDYEEKVKICVMEQLGVSFQPITGAIELEIVIVYGLPKTMTNQDKAYILQGGTIYKTTLPDLTDNLIKGICDGMQGKVYLNDGQVCKIKSQKIYGEIERAVIIIRTLDQRQITNTLL